MNPLAILAVAGYIAFWTIVLSLAARRFLELRAGPVRLHQAELPSRTPT